MKKFASLCLLIVCALAPTGCSHTTSDRKLIVLGFDGADPELAERWMSEGKLPNLKALRDEGCYHHLATTNPAQSPTAWSCFSTGLNPGRTSIFGFLRRVNTGDRPMPEISYVTREWSPVLGRWELAPLALAVVVFIGVYLALARGLLVRVVPSLVTALVAAAVCGGALRLALDAWLPHKMIRATQAKRGDDFWNTLGEKGVPSKVIWAPLTFPVKDRAGCKLLSGLGTPDLKGTHGSWAVYSSEAVFPTATETGGMVLPVKIEGNSIRTEIPGPDDPMVMDKMRRLEASLASAKSSDAERDRLQKQLDQLKAHRELKASLHIRLDPAKQEVILHSGKHEHHVPLGQWSRWMSVEFRSTPLIAVKGMVRFYLVSLAPRFEMYMSPIEINPSHVPPTISISTPRAFSQELVEQVGAYNTLGWSAPTNPLKDEKLDDDAFMSYVMGALKQRREMVLKELAKPDWACFCAIFEEPDHSSHVLWRYEDKTHPMHDEKAAAKHGDDLLRIYQFLDGVVGDVRKQFVNDKTALIIVSDHGFKSFRRSVNINNWLAENGYLALREPATQMKLADLSQGGNVFFSNVDWSKTRAYSMDLGKIFINLKGREPKGLVEPGAQYESLCKEIAEKFSGLTDTGAPVVHKVYRREEIFHGPFVKDEADLIIGFNAGYRVSWQTCLGGMGAKVIEDNRNAWSADHCSLDPSQVPGIFFSNCKTSRDDIALMDLAPTVLQYFKLPPHEALDGKAFALENK